MFAKVLKGKGRDNGFKIFENIFDIDVGSVQSYPIDFLDENKITIYSNDYNSNDLVGRIIKIIRKNKEDVDVVSEIFCDSVVYLCNESGNTVDRVSCFPAKEKEE